MSEEEKKKKKISSEFEVELSKDGLPKGKLEAKAKKEKRKIRSSLGGSQDKLNENR